jgi:hypothetical protein
MTQKKVLRSVKGKSSISKTLNNTVNIISDGLNEELQRPPKRTAIQIRGFYLRKIQSPERGARIRDQGSP